MLSKDDVQKYQRLFNPRLESLNSKYQTQKIRAQWLGFEFS
ncbi:hypothetical protein THF1C08_140060 [Vibrio jasicida]|nr:hypothetical protein THF1C08_140060 [Vibrio jasicida]